MKIYTRTGDAGETSLFDGTRVSKADARVDAYGEVDEVNAYLGLARAWPLDADVDEPLLQIQRDLFALGARLADPAGTIAARLNGHRSASSAGAAATTASQPDSLSSTIDISLEQIWVIVRVLEGAH